MHKADTINLKRTGLRCWKTIIGLRITPMVIFKVNEYSHFFLPEMFSALLALCAGKSLVTGEFPAQRPVTRSFDVFFDLRLHKQLNKQPWGWWFETLWRSLWRHWNANDPRETVICSLMPSCLSYRWVPSLLHYFELKIEFASLFPNSISINQFMVSRPKS